MRDLGREEIFPVDFPFLWWRSNRFSFDANASRRARKGIHSLTTRHSAISPTAHPEASELVSPIFRSCITIFPKS